MAPYKIVTISGPPGAGKTTAVKMLLEYPDKFRLLMSITTRPPRPDEIGEYHFVAPDEIQGMSDRGELWNFVKHHDHYYGMSLQEIDEALRANQVSLRIITPDEANRFHKNMPGKVLSLYLKGPSEAELRRRLKERGDSPEAVSKRLQDLSWDREYAGDENFVFIDPGTIDQTVARIKALVG